MVARAKAAAVRRAEQAEALTQNEDTLCEFAFDVRQARVTEPPQIETFSAADARRAAVEAVYYYAISGELYETDIKAALEVLLQCAFQAH